MWIISELFYCSKDRRIANTAAHYGFQIATLVGQMAFQKWLQDRQMAHADRLHEDGKMHQNGLTEKQNSMENIAKNAAVSAGVSSGVGYLISSIASWFKPQQ